MAFITDKEELKPGLIIFRRGDVMHRNFYCRVKLPKDDGYKTIALGTPNPQSARDRAFASSMTCRYSTGPSGKSRRNLSPCSSAALTQARFPSRASKISKNVLLGALGRYVGSARIHLVGQDRWAAYPTWRRENGKGRHRDHISDATIDFEMGAFNAAMNFAIRKRYVPANQPFEGKPKLKTMCRDEFTLEEYRKLHTAGRSWITKATNAPGTWSRTMCYNFMLIMCNTGMRPPEAKKLRWRDIMAAKDRDGKEIVVLFVQGKGKSRKLVAPKSVGDYLDRIRAISKAT